MMAAVLLYSVCAIIAAVSTISSQEGDTCQACNCQLNNGEVLNRLIESKIAAGKLATTTVKLPQCQECIRIVCIHVHGVKSNKSCLNDVRFYLCVLVFQAIQYLHSLAKKKKKKKNKKKNTMQHQTGTLHVCKRYLITRINKTRMQTVVLQYHQLGKSVHNNFLLQQLLYLE